MITRALHSKVSELATKFPFVLITGPRQSGKSTLAKIAFPDYRYVSFSDIDMRMFAKEDPRGFLATYPAKTIIDEVQKEPSILSYLQTHADDEDREANLSFWRDSNGNEVDLLSTEGTEQFTYEIKSGATFNKDYFKGLDYWAKLSGADAAHRTVVYGGDRGMKTSDGNITPWIEL